MGRNDSMRPGVQGRAGARVLETGGVVRDDAGGSALSASQVLRPPSEQGACLRFEHALYGFPQRAYFEGLGEHRVGYSLQEGAGVGAYRVAGYEYDAAGLGRVAAAYAAI